MKLIKILTAFIALASLQIAAAQWLNVPPPAEAKNLMVFTAGTPVAGGITCSGDFRSGNNESFEKGAGQFCTSNWVESDAGDVIDLYNTDKANCGTHSMKLTGNASWYFAAGAWTDLTEQASGYLRFAFWVPATTADYDAPGFVHISNDAGTLNHAVLRLLDNAGSDIRLTHTGGLYTDYFTVTAGAKYYVAVTWNSAAAWRLRVWDSAGTALVSNLTSVNIDFTPANNAAIKSITFTGGAVAGVVSYVDDVKISLSSDIGGVIVWLQS